MNTIDNLFCAVMPCGISYSDSSRERNGDYVKLAFLSFATLELTFAPDCPRIMADRIKRDAQPIQERRGQQYTVTTTGQTVMLGTTQPSPKEYAVTDYLKG